MEIQEIKEKLGIDDDVKLRKIKKIIDGRAKERDNCNESSQNNVRSLGEFIEVIKKKSLEWSCKYDQDFCENNSDENGISINAQNKIQIWFRGQSYPYILRPSIYREEYNISEMYQNFRLQGAFLNNSPKPFEYDKWMVLMQHFKLPTHLLDWTSNALFALYYAIHENPEEPVVWMLNPLKLNYYTESDVLSVLQSKLQEKTMKSEKECKEIEEKFIRDIKSIEDRKNNEFVRNKHLTLNELKPIFIENNIINDENEIIFDHFDYWRDMPFLLVYNYLKNLSRSKTNAYSQILNPDEDRINQLFKNCHNENINIYKSPLAIQVHEDFLRIRAQKGRFTIHAADKRCLFDIFKNFHDNNKDEYDPFLHRINILGYHNEYLNQLAALGATYSTFFPDYEGLAYEMKTLYKK